MSASRYTIAKERGGMGQVEWSDHLIKVSDAVDIIRHLPSVAPARKVGKWIDKEKIMFPICSKYGLISVEKYSFCPNCGTKMDEEVEKNDKRRSNECH